MKNLSRRDFLRLSGATVLAVGMTGALSGCDDDKVSETFVEFGETVKMGDCEVTFYNIQADKGYFLEHFLEHKACLNFGVVNNGTEAVLVEKENISFWLDDGKQNITAIYFHGGESKWSTAEAAVRVAAGQKVWIRVIGNHTSCSITPKSGEAKVTISGKTVKARTNNIEVLGEG